MKEQKLSFRMKIFLVIVPPVFGLLSLYGSNRGQYSWSAIGIGLILGGIMLNSIFKTEVDELQRKIEADAARITLLLVIGVGMIFGPFLWLIGDLTDNQTNTIFGVLVTVSIFILWLLYGTLNNLYVRMYEEQSKKYFIASITVLLLVFILGLEAYIIVESFID